MAIEAQNPPPTPPLTEEIVKVRMEQMFGAAVRSDARNAVSDLATKARNALISNTNPEGIVNANTEVMGQWLALQQKNLAEGKDPNAKKTGVMDTLTSFWNGGILSAIMTYIGDSKIALIAESAMESFSNKDKSRDFNSILAEKTQEHKIRNFAAQHGIDGDRLLAEIKNPPKGTAELASVTPEQQLERLTAAETAKTAKEATERKAADDAEVARQVRLAEEVEKAKARQHAAVPEPTVKQGESGEQKHQDSGKGKNGGTKFLKPVSYDLTGTEGSLKGVTQVAEADNGHKIPLHKNALGGAIRNNDI